MIKGTHLINVFSAMKNNWENRDKVILILDKFLILMSSWYDAIFNLMLNMEFEKLDLVGNLV